MDLIRFSLKGMEWDYKGVTFHWLPGIVKAHLLGLFVFWMQEMLVERWRAMFVTPAFVQYWKNLSGSDSAMDVPDALLGALSAGWSSVQVSNKTMVQQLKPSHVYSAMLYGTVAGQAKEGDTAVQGNPAFVPFRMSVMDARDNAVTYWKEFMAQNEDYIEQMIEENFIR